MSDLVPSVVPLSAGLSLQVPKLMAPPGSLLDVLNYEQVDMQGQKRIDGYARYDGGHISALNDFYVVNTSELEGTTTQGNGVVVNANGKPFAIVLGTDGTTTHLASLNDNLMPSYQWGREVITDPEQHYELLLTYMDVLRQGTEQLPGAVAGLHWFRDRLYAVADMVTLQSSGDPGYVPNQMIEDNEGNPTRVLDVLLVDEVYYTLINSMDASKWDNATTGKVASFFESRSEAQVLEEDEDGPYDFGWRFVHLGWSVPFEEGLSLYGGLPALNQNLGAIGAGWSSTGGNNGSPLILTQDVNITNGRAQVSGWKNSNTPSTYGLSPSNITATDDSYIYADAYVSWNGESRIITVPRDNLTEYPATATVEVDING